MTNDDNKNYEKYVVLVYTLILRILDEKYDFYYIYNNAKYEARHYCKVRELKRQFCVSCMYVYLFKFILICIEMYLIIFFVYLIISKIYLYLLIFIINYRY